MPFATEKPVTGRQKAFEIDQDVMSDEEVRTQNFTSDISNLKLMDKQRHLNQYPLDKKNHFSCHVLITCFFLHLLLNTHLDYCLIREVRIYSLVDNGEHLAQNFV